jgi:hypothetical protein
MTYCHVQLVSALFSQFLVFSFHMPIEAADMIQSQQAGFVGFATFHGGYNITQILIIFFQNGFIRRRKLQPPGKNIFMHHLQNRNEYRIFCYFSKFYMKLDICPVKIFSAFHIFFQFFKGVGKDLLKLLDIVRG